MQERNFEHVEKVRVILIMKYLYSLLYNYTQGRKLRVYVGWVNL